MGSCLQTTTDILVELLVVELVEDDLLVARHRLRLVDVRHLEQRDRTAVLDGELVDERVVRAAIIFILVTKGILSCLNICPSAASTLSALVQTA